MEQHHTPERLVNVAAHLPKMAAQQPYTKAVIFPVGRDKQGRATYSHMTYKQLDQESDKIACGLEDIGIKRGTKTILMVKPSLEFFSLTFSLFKVGAVPVLIDPGMGLKRMLHCLQSTKAEAFIGIPLAHAMRVMFSGYFSTIKTHLTVGKRWFWSGPALSDITDKPYEPYEMAPTRGDEVAAILFTTGSTGPAKGVVYLHENFDMQVTHLQRHFGISPGEVDLATFPLFSLFAPALGMTSLVPDMDATRPADVDPAKIIEAIQNHGATTMFGSPALLNRVGRYGEAHGIKLPSLRRVLSAGAPVTHDNIKRFSKMLRPEAQIHTPYGATECLPVASIASHELLAETQEQTARGEGICVGRPMEDLTVRIIKVNDNPIPEWSDDFVVPNGEIGEITVKGRNATREYYGLPEATAKAKIKEGDEVVHRMGDLGWFDENGRIWFCGRKAHRVQTAEGDLYTVRCEAIFSQHPRVYRSALVGLGDAPNQKPVILIELEADDNKRDLSKLKGELLAMAQKHEHTKSIQTLMFHPKFPVDIRHNAKIFREKLAVWAYERR